MCAAQPGPAADILRCQRERARPVPASILTLAGRIPRRRLRAPQSGIVPAPSSGHRQAAQAPCGRSGRARPALGRWRRSRGPDPRCRRTLRWQARRPRRASAVPGGSVAGRFAHGPDGARCGPARAPPTRVGGAPLGRLGVPALDVLGRLARALVLAGGRSVLGGPDQLFGGQRVLLVASALARLGFGAFAVALGAELVRAPTCLVHRRPVFVHARPRAHDVLRLGRGVLGLGARLLGRALLPRPRALGGGFGQLLMVGRVVLVGRGEHPGALLIGAGAFLCRSRPLACRVVAGLGIGLLVIRRGLLVEGARVELGDLAQALLDLTSVGPQAVTVRRLSLKLVDRGAVLRCARSCLFGFAACTQRPSPAGWSDLPGLLGSPAVDRSAVLGVLGASVAWRCPRAAPLRAARRGRSRRYRRPPSPPRR